MPTGVSIAGYSVTVRAYLSAGRSQVGSCGTLDGCGRCSAQERTREKICGWRRVEMCERTIRRGNDKCARGRRRDAVGVRENGDYGMRGCRRVGGTSANSMEVEQVQPRLDGGVLWGAGERKIERAWMGVVKKVKGSRRGRGECGCGVGMREEMRVPFLVGDFEMASMSRKGRLVIFLMRAVTLRNDGEVKAESRGD